MTTPGRRFLAFGALLLLAFVGCALIYVALQTRTAWWLLGALAVFALLAVLWVRTIVALRRSARRDPYRP